MGTGDGMLGANLEQLERLAAVMGSSGDNIRTTTQHCSSILQGVPWHGPDAARFRERWATSLAPRLVGIAEALALAGRTLVEQAAQQAGTSDDDGGGSGSGSAGDGGLTPQEAAARQELESRLADMTPEEREEYLQSEEFRQWMQENPEAAKAALDAAFDNGDLVADSEAYENFLINYWNDNAMREAGIDSAAWRPELGTEANAETITEVYEYYGRLFLENPDLQWAGMANMIGPSFAGGFYDLDLMRDTAQAAGDIPDDIPMPDDVRERLDQLASLPDSELEFYETELLSMQKEIFLDQAMMHQAYTEGGMEQIERLVEAGSMTPTMGQAWADIDSRDPARISRGNEALLDREQNEIIVDNYQAMQDRQVTGDVVTWGLSLVGEPSIPGARSYPEIFPVDGSIESPGPETIFGRDNPVQGSVDWTTGLPDGNIANQADRWALIQQDTLPAYQELLRTNPEEAARIVESNFNDRLQANRPINNIDEITARILAGFDVEVNQ
ncbi:hypothetical protein GCM10027403_10060 [Arthrobacter tecti]